MYSKGFEFEFEGASEDGNFYVDNTSEFNMLTTMLPIEEVGISFSGEVQIDEKTSVITDKQVRLESPEIAIRTYKKVMEMRELTETERLQVGKCRLFFKKLFEVFYRNQKWRVYYSIFLTTMFGLDVASENIFGCFMMAACLAMTTSPVKFVKELKKMLGSNKRKEMLKEELLELNVCGYVNSVDDDEGIQLYFRPKATQK